MSAKPMHGIDTYHVEEHVTFSNEDAAHYPVSEDQRRLPVQKIDREISSFIIKVGQLIMNESRYTSNCGVLHDWTEESVLDVKFGRRYIKVMKGTRIWAFVDRTNGDVLKPATWKAPAKHARGNIFDAANGLWDVSLYGPAYLDGMLGCPDDLTQEDLDSRLDQNWNHRRDRLVDEPVHDDECDHIALPEDRV